MEGRTVKSLQNQWTAFNKKMEAYKHGSADGSTPATPIKKTPGKSSPSPEHYFFLHSELTYLKPASVLPRRRRQTPRTRKSMAPRRR